jgi:ABC-type amino acid transport system permease subunit
MRRKYNFFNSQEFEQLVPYIILGLIYFIIMLILFSI